MPGSEQQRFRKRNLLRRKMGGEGGGGEPLKEAICASDVCLVVRLPQKIQPEGKAHVDRVGR